MLLRMNYVLRRGVNNSRCEVDERTVREICSLLAAGYTAAEIRNEGFDYSLVRAIKAKKNWNHISKDYSF